MGKAAVAADSLYCQHMAGVRLIKKCASHQTSNFRDYKLQFVVVHSCFGYHGGLQQSGTKAE